MQDSTFYFRFFFLILMPESFDKHFKLLHFKKKKLYSEFRQIFIELTYKQWQINISVARKEHNFRKHNKKTWRYFFSLLIFLRVSYRNIANIINISFLKILKNFDANIFF